MKENRPDFKDIHSFEDFNLYYWYREELSQICKSLGLEYRGTKQELNDIIHQYFLGNKVEKSVGEKKQKQSRSYNFEYSITSLWFFFQPKIS